jgi:steroid delta-isomerase-like uncharacterized protein
VGANGTVVRRLITEAWTGQNVGLVDELVAEEYLEHAPFGEVVGREGYRDGIAMFRAAFADIALTVHDLIEQNDRVAARFTFRARHEGEFFGAPASNADVSMDGITIARLDDGRVIEEWLSVDMLRLMRQIGAVAPE